MKQLLFAAFYFLPIACFCQDSSKTSSPGWIYFGANNNGEEWYIKEQPVTAEYGKVKIWIKYVSPTDVVKNTTYQNTLTKQLITFDCKGRKISRQDLYVTSSAGEMITIYVPKVYETTWDNVVPDTFGEQLFDKVCSLFNKP